MKAKIENGMRRAEDEQDILDMLPIEGSRAVDRIGFDFLAKHGYDTDGAETSGRVCHRILRKMRKNGHVLEYQISPMQEDGTVTAQFFLKKGDELIDRSRKIKLVFGGQIGGEP